MSTMSTSAGADLDFPALRAWRAECPGLTIVDVRTPGEYAGTHIDGSHNLPLDLVRQRADDVVAALPGPIAVLCGSGPRSQEAARLLRTHGASDVRVLDGGIQAWVAAGGEVEQGQGTWAMERQVRLVAGSIVLTGVLSSVVAPKAKWLAAAIGAGLTFSALTNTCAMAQVLGRLPYNQPAGGFDADAAISALRSV
jgi:rhodanese-related sulfurtransferase